MAVKFANLASTTLASATTNSATSLTVSDASSFPSLGGGDYFYASIGEGLTSEIVKVTAVSSNTLTVTRGQDGTTAAAHSAGTVVALRVVAAALDDIASQAQTAADTESVSIAGDTMTGTLNFSSAADPLISSQYGDVLWHDDQFSQNLIQQVYAATIGDYLQLRAGGSGTNVNHKFGEGYADLGGYLKIDGTTRIDNSGNATLGTISSGAITSSGALVAGDNIVIGSGGTYQAGNIYSDANWGMIFRAKQLSPQQADFLWTDAGDTHLLKLDNSGDLGVLTGGYKIGTQTVIDSSRNLGNINAGTFGQAVSAMDTTNLDLEVAGNTSIRGSSALYFGITSNNYNSWKGKIWNNNTSTMQINAQALNFNNSGYGTSTFFLANSTGFDIRTGGLLINQATVIDTNRQFSGSLASSVTATTQSASDNSTKVATTAYVTTAVDNIVDSAPGTLDTLNELAAALGDDANFSTTVTNSIATKLPLAGGTMTGTLIVDAGSSGMIDFGNVTTAYGRLYADNSGTFIGSKSNHPLILRSNHTTALTLDTSQNATFAGAISSGAITSSGKVIATQLDLVGTDVYIAYGSAGTAPSNGDYLRLRDVASGNDALQFYMDSSKLFSIDGQTGNAYHKGTISSGGITSSGNVEASTLSVNHAGALSGTQFYIKKQDSSTNLQRWGEGTSGQDTYRFRIDQNFKFIGNSGSGDNIILDSDNGNIRGTSFNVGGTTVISSSRNLTNIGTISSGAITSSGQLTLSGNNLAVFGPNSAYSRSLAIGGNANNSTSTRASIGATNGNLHIDAALGAFGTYLNFYDGTNGVYIGNGAGATTAHFSSIGHLALAGDQGDHVSGYALTVGGVGVLSTGRNLASIGTISSGAITSGAIVATGTGTTNTTYSAVFKNNNGTNVLRVRDDGKVLIEAGYLYVNHNDGIYSTGAIRARGGISNDGGNALSISSGAAHIAFNSKNFASVGTISSGAITTSGTFTGHNINLRNDTAGDGATIRDISFLTTAAQGTDDRIALIRANNQAGDSTNRGGKLTFFTRQSGSANFNSALILDKDGNTTLSGTLTSGAITSTGATSSFGPGSGATYIRIGDQVTDNNPGGWNKGVHLNSLYHGRFRIRTTNSTYGALETYYWADSTVTPSMGIYGNTSTFKFTGSITTLQNSSGNTFWHAGNDGTGSGLDADLLDGKHASEFVEHMDGSRTNAANLNSYTDSGFYNTGAATTSNKPSGASDYAQLIVAKGIDTGLQLYGGYNNPTLYVRGWHQSSNFFAWRKLWNDSNDGSGSGLDADLLDGQHGSYYQPASTAITTANIASQSVSSATNIDGRAFTNTGSNASVNADTINTNGISYYTSGVTNFSGNASDGALYSQQYSTSWQHQIAGDYRSGQIAVRGRNSGTWQSWYKVWSANNDGSGSGLDADLLDGNQASAFLTTSGKAADSNLLDGIDSSRVVYGTDTSKVTRYNGDWNTMFGAVNTGFFDNSSGTNGNPDGFTHHHGFQVRHNNLSNEWGYQFMGSYHPSYQSLYHRNVNGGTWSAWKEIWDSGNDGAGSGLDADLLDGKNSTDFTYYRGIVSGDWDTIFTSGTGKTLTSGLYEVHNISSGSHSNYPSGAYTYGGVFAWYLNNSTFKLYAPHTGTLWYQTGWGNDEYSGWRKIWDNNNDGSGSGLDADLLDGQQGSYYYPASNPNNYTSNTGTLTGNQTITLSGPVTGSGTTSISTSNPYQTAVTFQGSNGNSPDSAMEYQQGSGVTDTKISPTGDWHNSIRMGHGDPYNYYSNTIALQMTGGLTGTLRTQAISNNNAQGWRTVWDTGNDGAGSGLDADLLDGQHGSYYAPASHNHSGVYLPIGSKAADSNLLDGIDSTGFVNQLGDGASPDYQTPSSRRVNPTTSNPTNAHHAISTFGNGSNVTGQLATHFQSGQAYTRGYNNSWSAWRTQWDNLNDGSGSGLDADLLDGQQGSYYNQSQFTGSAFTSRNSGNYIAIDSVTTNMIGYVTGSTAAGYADGAGFSAAYSSSWVGQLFVDFRTGKLSTRGKNNGTWQSHRFMWDNLNDGSGSGLDADLLDGNDSTAFPKLAATNTWGNNAINYFRVERGGYSGSLSTANLQVYTTGANSAFMSFHRSGAYAVNMGLDADNVLRIGGWSASANRWVLDMSGNMTAAGNVTAYSDIRLKENIEVIPNALEKVKQIRGVTFTRNDQEDKELRHTGVIAQEVEKVLPEVVSEDNLGVKNVAYGNMVGLLIEAVKELQQEVDYLKTKLGEK